MTLLQQMTDNGKLNNFLCYSLATLCANWGINSFLIVRTNHSLTLGMLKKNWNNYNPFLDIICYIPYNLLMTCMLTKIILFKSKQFVHPFYLSTNLASSLTNISTHLSYKFMVAS